MVGLVSSVFSDGSPRACLAVLRSCRNALFVTCISDDQNRRAGFPALDHALLRSGHLRPGRGLLPLLELVEEAATALAADRGLRRIRGAGRGRRLGGGRPN